MVLKPGSGGTDEGAKGSAALAAVLPAPRLDAPRDLQARRRAGHGVLAEAERVEDLVDDHGLGHGRLTELDLGERLADEDAPHARLRHEGDASAPAQLLGQAVTWLR